MNLYLTPLNVCLFILGMPSCSFKIWTCSVWQIFKYLKIAIMCSLSSFYLSVNITNFSSNSQITRLSLLHPSWWFLSMTYSRILISLWSLSLDDLLWFQVCLQECIYIRTKYEIAFINLRKHQWVHICLPGKCLSL